MYMATCFSIFLLASKATKQKCIHYSSFLNPEYLALYWKRWWHKSSNFTLAVKFSYRASFISYPQNLWRYVWNFIDRRNVHSPKELSLSHFLDNSFKLDFMRSSHVLNVEWADQKIRKRKERIWAIQFFLFSTSIFAYSFKFSVWVAIKTSLRVVLTNIIITSRLWQQK